MGQLYCLHKPHAPRSGEQSHRRSTNTFRQCDGTPPVLRLLNALRERPARHLCRKLWRGSSKSPAAAPHTKLIAVDWDAVERSAGSVRRSGGIGELVGASSRAGSGPSCRAPSSAACSICALNASVASIDSACVSEPSPRNAGAAPCGMPGWRRRAGACTGAQIQWRRAAGLTGGKWPGRAHTPPAPRQTACTA